MNKKVIVALLLFAIAPLLGACSQEEETTQEPTPVVEVEKEPIIEENKPQQATHKELTEMFNQDLTKDEQAWLDHYSFKYPEYKIYHIKTKVLTYCEGCYEMLFKKGNDTIKATIKNSRIEKESTINDFVSTEIEDKNICEYLYKGTWNECPKICITEDECDDICGEPVCELEFNTEQFKKLGESCDSSYNNGCELDLKCVYENPDDEFGICQK